jgi:SAM-dependent methyltransferase
MEAVEYEKMFALEDFYWWFVARRKLVLFLIRGIGKSAEPIALLDIGCGTGAMLKDLQPFGNSVGIDYSDESLRFCRNRKISRLAQCNAENLGLKSGSFDLVISLDVFEHLDNDMAGIRECFRVCKEGGVLVMTVPAYDFLWSEHDEALGHKRRYSARELREKLNAAGFRVEKLSYIITCLFFPIAVFRFLQNLLKPSTRPQTRYIVLPAILNRLLIYILGMETRLIRWMSLPAGVSLVCVARKGNA